MNDRRIAPSPPTRAMGVWLVALVGAALATWQYAAGASLWLDELALVRNVIDRPWGELLSRPLSFAQVAPVGFLALEKLAVTVAGESDRALRLVPFLSLLIGLAAFASVSRRLLDTRGALVAVAIVALSSRLIWNGAQAKQYAGDVMVASGVLWLTVWLLDRASARRGYAAAVLGVAGAFLSQPGAFVLTAGAAALILSRRGAADPERRRGLAIVSAAWIVAAVAAGLLARSLVTAETMAFMREFWVAGFPPLPPHSLTDLLWPWQALRGLFGTALTIPGIEAYALLALAGLVVLLKRHPIGVVVAGAIVLAMIAAAARLFPFNDRPIVFAVPLVALACGASVQAIGQIVAGRAPILAWAVCAVLIAAPAYRISRRPPVYRVQDTRPLAEWIGSERKPGDALYVFYGAGQAARHYGPRAGFDSLFVVQGQCHRGEPRAYFRELDALRGKARTWVFITHAEPRFGERDAVMGYLDSIGVRRQSRTIPEPYVRSVASAEAHLYDLSGAERLARSSAGSALVPPGSERSALRRECRGPFMP